MEALKKNSVGGNGRDVVDIRLRFLIYGYSKCVEELENTSKILATASAENFIEDLSTRILESYD
jgi:hypothetical protein